MVILSNDQALVPKKFRSAMDAQQNNQDWPYIFFYVILFYLKSNYLLYS